MLALIAPLQWLVDIFQPILVLFHDLVGSWGMAIILLVVAVRIVVLPLTVKQMRSMQAMAHLAPEMKAIQQKYKDDSQRQQLELRKLYSENNVNPFSSCLPLVAQIPVFIALFYLLQDNLKMDICGPALQEAGRAASNTACDEVAPGSAQFLFISDLTATPGGWVLAVLIALYVGSQLVASLLSMTSANKTQRRIFLALPFLFVLFVINFPAGLIVYWITTNIWTAVQGYVIRRRIGPLSPPKPEGEEPTSLREWFRQLTGAQEAPGSPAAATAGASPKRKPAGPPPPPPRKKKKRSGRRR